jgi:hypothetical protein
MLKRTIIAALWLPLIALAQTYPSPTFQNVTVRGTLSVTGAPTFTLPVPVASGGTNCSAASGTCLDNITGFASTGFLTRTGAGAYAFQSLTNGITLGNIAQVGANTLLGNATSSTANVAAVSVAGCNGAAQALQWTNGSGFQCNSSIATSGANANITSLSGLTTPLSVSQGGSGLATRTAHAVQVGNGASAVTQIGVGATGQVLVGATNADPAFGSTVGPLTFTGAITPSSTAGIVGTATNDNANAGSDGEFICAQVTNGGTPTGCQTNSSTPVSLTSNTPANVTSVSLTAGDWDCRGNVIFNNGGTTVTTQSTASINTVSATTGSQFSNYSPPSTSGINPAFATPTVRESLASTTTVYLVSNNVFSTSTSAVYGRIDCRRVR